MFRVLPFGLSTACYVFTLSFVNDGGLEVEALGVSFTLMTESMHPNPKSLVGSESQYNTTTLILLMGWLPTLT